MGGGGGLRGSLAKGTEDPKDTSGVAAAFDNDRVRSFWERFGQRERACMHLCTFGHLDFQHLRHGHVTTPQSLAGVEEPVRRMHSRASDQQPIRLEHARHFMCVHASFVHWMPLRLRWRRSIQCLGRKQQSLHPSPSLAIPSLSSTAGEMVDKGEGGGVGPA